MSIASIVIVNSYVASLCLRVSLASGQASHVVSTAVVLSCPNLVSALLCKFARWIRDLTGNEREVTVRCSRILSGRRYGGGETVTVA